MTSNNTSVLTVVGFSGFLVSDRNEKIVFNRDLVTFNIEGGKCIIHCGHGRGTFKLTNISIKDAIVQSDGLKVVTNRADSAQFLRNLQNHLNANKASLEAEKQHKLDRKRPSAFMSSTSRMISSNKSPDIDRKTAPMEADRKTSGVVTKRQIPPHTNATTSSNAASMRSYASSQVPPKPTKQSSSPARVHTSSTLEGDPATLSSPIKSAQLPRYANSPILVRNQVKDRDGDGVSRSGKRAADDSPYRRDIEDSQVKRSLFGTTPPRPSASAVIQSSTAAGIVGQKTLGEMFAAGSSSGGAGTTMKTFGSKSLASLPFPSHTKPNFVDAHTIPSPPSSPPRDSSLTHSQRTPVRTPSPPPRRQTHVQDKPAVWWQKPKDGSRVDAAAIGVGKGAGNMVELWDDEEKNKDDDDYLVSPLRSYTHNTSAPNSLVAAGLDLRTAWNRSRVTASSGLGMSMGIGGLRGGIRNLGNTCYISAVLQALFALPHLPACLSLSRPSPSNAQPVNLIPAPQITQTAHSAHSAHNTTTLIPTPLLGALRQLLTRRGEAGWGVKGDSMALLDAKGLKQVLCKQFRQFDNSSQQDAQEFLTCLLTQLEDEQARELGPLVLAHSKHGKAAAAVSLVPSPLSITDLPPTVQKEKALAEEDMEVSAQELQALLPASSMPAASVTTSTSTSMDIAVTPSPPSPLNTNKQPRTTQPSTSTPAQTKPALTSSAPALAALLPPAFLFESRVQVCLQCVECQYEHPSRVETYRDIPLSLPADGMSASVVSLPALLHSFFSPEVRDLPCPACSRGTRVRVRKSMHTLPPVLAIHLKRFSEGLEDASYVKLHTPVDFPSSLSIADVVPNTPQKNSEQHVWGKCAQVVAGEYDEFWEKMMRAPAPLQPVIDNFNRLRCALTTPAYTYKLYGVVRHRGISMNAGHYICDAFGSPGQKDADAQRWFRCDDAFVQELTEDVVLAEKDSPYMLFYAIQPCK
eukprot:gene31722-38339_t